MEIYLCSKTHINNILKMRNEEIKRLDKNKNHGINTEQHSKHKAIKCRILKWFNKTNRRGNSRGLYHDEGKGTEAFMTFMNMTSCSARFVVKGIMLFSILAN